MYEVVVSMRKNSAVAPAVISTVFRIYPAKFDPVHACL